ncbi:hypothetical protein IscW_ISCW012812 [Ixodes scapularis]|uniref:Uncharacterized protein n=1 Tax=Ixodes scapularis TaxID=6945 RepID=B7QE65_IXOSC|nr:hypothetical protein IscW_ISCW012812 [Ixodes scapularis]|eukprot:XP_002413829.1 hypothetical protein IscW_ISCW012812 [Ixodes scapularis]
MDVEGLDDDNGRVIVKLALGGSAATVNESFITLVTKKEYARDGKLLNKNKYDEYKRKHEPQEEEPGSVLLVLAVSGTTSGRREVSSMVGHFLNMDAYVTM